MMPKIPTLKRKKFEPLIPIDYADPTELGVIRAGAIRRVNERFDFILRHVKAYIRDEIKPTGSRQVNSQLNRYAANGVSKIDSHQLLATNETLWDYLFGDEEYQEFTDFLNGLMWSSLLSNALALLSYTRQTRVYVVEWQPNWWFNEYLDKSTQKGLKNIVTSAKYQTTRTTTDSDLSKRIRDLSTDSMIESTTYKSAVRTTQRAAFSEMKSITEGLTGTLAEILRQGVRDGLSQKELIKKVTKQLLDSDAKDEGQARRKARNMVRNRLNNARRESGRDHIKQLNSEVYADTPYEMRQLWFSALIPGRTRYWHASRHGKTHTVEEDEQFYSEGGNRYNCYCNQTAILVYRDTGLPVTDTGLLKRMEDQKAAFMG